MAEADVKLGIQMPTARERRIAELEGEVALLRRRLDALLVMFSAAPRRERRHAARILESEAQEARGRL